MQFRPFYGEETIDSSVIEQLIAPLLRAYEADGTAVFDCIGGAAVKRLQSPDECLMFVVDCSASMRGGTDFEDIDHYASTSADKPTITSIVDPSFYSRAKFDELLDMLREYEGLNEMVAIVNESSDITVRSVAGRVIQILRSMLASEVLEKHKDIERHRGMGAHVYYLRQQIASLDQALTKLKMFWAGLKTHEEALIDFLLFRASTITSSSQKWTWSMGDPQPSVPTPPQNIPKLDAEILEVPDSLRCPISHSLIEDAVTAADKITYSREAISRWFQIRRSSPMHGVMLDDIALDDNENISKDVEAFISGRSDGLVSETTERPQKRHRSATAPTLIQMRFESPVGRFDRQVSSNTTFKDMYRLAFRGLKARHLVFQLAIDGSPIRPSAELILNRAKGNNVTVTIRIADDEPVSARDMSARASQSYCLVKVYQDATNMLFAFWVKKDTSQTMQTILWKYWRYCLHNFGLSGWDEQQVWTDMSDSGDNLLVGHPQSNTARISHLLNSVHCFGHLGDEKVYREQKPDILATGNLVLKVKINHPFEERDQPRNKMTRLDVLKQMFEALINRLLAYGYKTHVGLVTVSTESRLVLPMSHVLENFRRATTDMQAHGDTALWNGLALARDQLVEYSSKYPTAAKRIIVISDGQDTTSTTNTSQEVCWRLRQHAIVVDSVALGDENNSELRTLSYILGSYRFHPTSLVNALAICEMEPFSSLTERPPIVTPGGLPNNRLSFLSRFWNMKYMAVPTVVSADSVPPRKVHDSLQDTFVQLSADLARHPPTAAISGLNSSRQTLRVSRLMNEMRFLMGNANPQYDVYVSERNMCFWKVVMAGPEGSPYAEGTFVLYIDADEGYPTFAPKARFITKIRHPNVNAHGRICHSIFDRDWTSDTSMTTLLDTVYGLLYQPEISDPVNTATTLGFHHDQVEFAEEVRDYVRRHACKCREQWKAELLGGAAEDGEDDEDDECDEGDGFDEESVDFDDGEDDEDVDANEEMGEPDAASPELDEN